MNDWMREEFEEWAAEEAEVRGVGELIGLLKDERHDRYAMIWTQTAWMAWQASRESLVIDLPSVQCIDVHDYSARDVLSFCEKAVRDSGAKTA